MSKDSKIEVELQDALGDQLVSLEWDNDSYKMLIVNADKSINVSWPYPLQETYFDFHEGKQKVFHESIEMYDGETHSEMIEYIKYLTHRFLNMTTRINSNGAMMKTQTLEVFDGTKWESVFQ